MSTLKEFAADNNLELTLYNTIPTFNNSEKEALLKHCREKEKMLVMGIFSFSHNVFYPIIIILTTYNLSSAYALNLVQFKNCHLVRI